RPAPQPFRPEGQVSGQRVIILGAGLTGMAAAYELGKLGYNCQILEARARPGGRCWTVRRGTTETDLDGATQIAKFDRGLYFNPGPARIPQHHHTTLDYCKTFKVPVEVFTNVNEAAYYYNQGSRPLNNRPVRIRAAKADMRGYVSELLAKAISQEALDQPLTGADRQRMLDFLSQEGALSAARRYTGSNRRGFRSLPGAGQQPGTVDDPMALDDLLQAGFGSYFSTEYDIHQQMTMFQIVGGTDRLAAAFEQRVGDKITYQAEVTEIRRTSQGVRIVYRAGDRDEREQRADFCICTIPLSVLRDIPADFSTAMQRAIAAVFYLPTGKVGLQFSRRFWEEDDRIFGGISRTNLNITQIWYPSSGYLGQKGILVGAYNFAQQAINLGNLSPEQREAQVLREGGLIHPQYAADFENSFSVMWHNTEYSRGGWAFYSDDVRRTHYPVLNQPDGPIYLAGEHLSYLTGWMAGAFESAQAVVTALHERVLAGG
ncbi:MAG: flavin monoamine oxidase family protein, partial [Anaerolineae bacterium]|nr:flavin monoamine oxidase family protein [Anaerolineae bacterium]